MRVLSDPLVASVIGSMIIAIVEVAALGSFDPGLVAVVLVLFAALGLAIGLVIAGEESIVARMSLTGIRAALVRGLGALPPLVFVADGLFEGARASQLPGAAYAWLWVPALGFVGTVVALYAGNRWFVPFAVRRRVLAGLLAVVLVAMEMANRSLFRSEYPDVHAFLALLSCICASLALWLATGADLRRQWTRRRAVVWAAVVATLGGMFVLTLALGLGDSDNRWRLATRGSHARHIARVIRGAFDFDGDGFSSVLGGGDCDDGDPAVYPGAAEILGNGRDEDCDGVDSPVPPVAADTGDRRRMMAEWLASDDVSALLSRTRTMNVLIIAIDALRADVFFSDEGAKAMPRARGLAAESVVFSRAFAPSAGTDLSVSTVVTGRIDPFQRLETTLPEAMQRAGRATEALLPSEVLRYAGKVLLTRGIDRLDPYVNDSRQRDVGSYTTTADVTRQAVAAIKKRASAGEPFYMWLHFFDVHEHLQVERADPRLAKVVAGFDLGTRAGKYTALAALTDTGVGQVLDALEAQSLADNTIVVLISDHGESLAEDSRLPDNHGRFVYNALTHVPLAVRVPGLAPRRVDTAISIVDLTPTLLQLAGAEPIPDMDGTTLLPHLVEWAPESLQAWSRPIVLHESEQWGVIDWPLKLMVRPAENLTELYDLSVDFAEKRDVSGERGDDVLILKGLYAGFPEPSLDRTRAGRKRRDELARPPRTR